MKKYSLGALVAAGLLVGGLSAGSASAADLGGNCCADLEERIAELEATTARKGNRKVSLTISGWVAEQVMYWDDGFEQNVYVGGLGTTLSHATSSSPARPRSRPAGTLATCCTSKLTAATVFWRQQLRVVVDGPGLFAGTINYVQTLQSFWFVKSDHLGKLSLGLQSQASDNTAILVDGSGSLVPANWVQFDYGGFFFRDKATGAVRPQHLAAVMGVASRLQRHPAESVRYDSPTFAGFSVSASWGEDDFWDVAARYAGEWNGIKVAAAAAYSVSTSPGVQGVTAGREFVSTRHRLDDGPDLAKSIVDETQFFQVGAYVEHTPTGLFLYGAYGKFEADFAPGIVAVDDHDFWYVKAGLRERWTPLGHTVLYGEYEKSNDDGFGMRALAASVRLTDRRL